MPPQTLKSYLGSIAGDRTLIQYQGQQATAADLAQPIDQDVLDPLFHKKITVWTKDPLFFAHMMAALDGCAAAVFIAPASLDTDQLRLLMARFGSQALLTDLSKRTAPLADLPVFSTLKATAHYFSDMVTDTNPPPTTSWVLSTSGTTGTPKLVGHNLSSLTRTTKFDSRIGEKYSWGLLYDFSRFAGLQVFLQALLGGSPLICPPVDDDLGAKLRLFKEAKVTHLSTTPTMWRKILMSDQSTSLSLKQITLGGEIADQTVLSALAATYPAARISHVYASSEAGVGFSVTDGQEGFPCSFLENPPNGIAIRIKDGQLYIKNTQVNARYIGEDRRFGDDDGFIDTGDQVTQRADRIIFQGRSSGVINVGGDKVHPEEVEKVLLAHPLVAQAIISTKKSPIMGALVQATVLLKNPNQDHVAAKKDILDHCKQHLEKYKVPSIIKFSDTLTVNAAGKVIRDPSS